MGCSAPAPVLSKSAPATLAVSNITDYLWRLAITPVAGGGARNVSVAPHGVCTIELAGGEYEIEQTAETAALTRRIACRLESGQAYQWQLATLQGSRATGTP